MPEGVLSQAGALLCPNLRNGEVWGAVLRQADYWEVSTNKEHTAGSGCVINTTEALLQNLAW